MGYISYQRNPMRSVPAITGVALVHVALIYAVMNGMGRATIERPPLPPVMWVINEHITPPPPPPVVQATVKPVSTKVFVPPPPVGLKAPPSTPAPAAVSTTGSASDKPAIAPTPAADTSFSASAVISGARAPAYPESYADAARPGQVTVDCMIGTDGTPTHCKVVGASGGPAFAAETLRWLTGSSHPVFRPATRGGVAKREEHRWSITFQPPE